MPRKGAAQGERSIRWAVSLTPAELGLVEAVRRVGRADWLVRAARGEVERTRIGYRANPDAYAGGTDAWLARVEEAMRVLVAEREVLDDLAERDRTGRGGRKPAPHRLTAAEVAAAHVAMHRDPRLGDRLAEALAVLNEDA